MEQHVAHDDDVASDVTPVLSDKEILVLPSCLLAWFRSPNSVESRRAAWRAATRGHLALASATSIARALAFGGCLEARGGKASWPAGLGVRTRVGARSIHLQKKGGRLFKKEGRRARA